MNTSQSVGVAFALVSLSNSTGHQVHKTTHAWSRAGTVAGRPSTVYIHRILNMNLEFFPLLYITFNTQYIGVGFNVVLSVSKPLIYYEDNKKKCK